MKVVSTEALTKLIQLVKSAFISVDDTVETSEVTLATVATTGDYDDLINKPTIPTVNNSTITFTQGGVSKGSFKLNQSTGATIALDAGSSIQKITATNPALTSSNRICTWTISNTLGENVEVMIKKVSNNESVMFDYIPTSSTIKVKLYSTSNISSNTYKAVIVG